MLFKLEKWTIQWQKVNSFIMNNERLGYNLHKRRNDEFPLLRVPGRAGREATMKILRAAAITLVVYCAAPLANATEDPTIGFRGQLSGWLGYHDAPSAETAFGLRYIPAFSLKLDLGRGWALDSEISVNAFGSARGDSLPGLTTSGEVKPYRIWVRLASDRFEARLGLQKINFGSAMLLRPLMWFDRIDPNDPLQLTDGVYGLLLKYTFAGNANIWMWGLYGNCDPKGWETVGTKKTAPEFGGRVQVPVPAGEAALSYHHRTIDAANGGAPLPPGEWTTPPEDRLGFDGKWDLGVGVWVEAALTHQGYAVIPLRYQRTLTIGLDYTFGLGNGLHVLAEHLNAAAAAGAWEKGTARDFTGLTLDYPLGLFDRLSGMVFYAGSTRDWYRLLTWRRTYDRWSFYVIGFWNPDRYQLFPGQTGASLFAGKGIQFTIVFNH
jgi:hypothetical protein